MAERSRVLVIEPSEVIRRVLVILLEGEGFVVDAVARLDDAEQETLPALGWCPDLILMDVNTPSGHPSDLECRVLYTVLKHFPATVALVAMAAPGTVREVERVHLAAVVDKPFEVETLLAAVRKALQGRAVVPG